MAEVLEGKKLSSYAEVGATQYVLERGLDTDVMVLNMGPQHPATHGVLRVELITDGEIVVKATPYIGYLHRCFEKHAEALEYQMTIPYTDRMDYLSAMNNEWVYCMAVEKLLKIEVPRRIEFMRVIVAELNRIASHIVAIGTYGLDIGAFTPFLHTFHDREHIMNLLEWLCGARMLYNYIWIGGVSHDFPPKFKERVAEFLKYYKPRVDEMNNLLTQNELFVQRTRGVGVLPADVAINYGCSGPMLRGSGVKWDLRRNVPYSIYPELEFDVVVPKGDISIIGDCLSRHLVRCYEIYESIKIIEQCLDKMPEEPGFDPHKAVPKRIKPQAGEAIARGENPRGELAYYIIADGKGVKPYRVKARAPSFSNLSVLPELAKGTLISDLVAIVGSIDIVLGDVDR